MIPFAILAPHLDAAQAKIFRVAVERARLSWTPPVDALPDDGTRYVLSAGKDALDIWHDFGLVQVKRNHGDLYTHRAVSGRTFHIMVVEHPGAMQQLRFNGMEARDNMLRDLARWRETLTDMRHGLLRARWCGGCAKMREPRDRPAEFWVEELDMAGLCDDHYRKRAQYRRKETRVRVKDRGKMEHQIDGQIEMLPGDGTRVMVSKG